MPEDRFQKLPGIIETVVGYTGGTTEDPTYERIGDHTEAIRVTFNPRVLPLDELYRFFWREHQPSPSYFGAQYRSAVFCHGQSQRHVAAAVRSSLIGDSPFASSLGETAIEDAGPFYRAEEYHREHKPSLSHLLPSVVTTGLSAVL